MHENHEERFHVWEIVKERKREREREKEKDGCVVTSSMCVSMYLSGSEVCVDSGERLGRYERYGNGWLIVGNCC